MSDQKKTKPKILKKWILGKRKKSNFNNCHTNFKLIKNEIQANQFTSTELEIEQLNSVIKLNEVNKINEDKKKHSLLPSKDTILTRIFRSLTSSSSNSNNPSNASDMSTQNSASNGCSNENNAVKCKEEEDLNKTDETEINFDSNEIKNCSQAFDNNLVNNNSIDLLSNLSLNSFETSPKRINNNYLNAKLVDNSVEI